MEQHVNNVREYLNGDIELLKETRNCIYFDNGSHMKLKTFHQIRTIIRTDTKRERIVVNLVAKSYDIQQQVTEVENKLEIIHKANAVQEAIIASNITLLKVIRDSIGGNYPVQLNEIMQELVIYTNNFHELHMLCKEKGLKIKRVHSVADSFVSVVAGL